MLVLSRRENEKILFPGLGIEVQVVKTNANIVRLGIEAPSDVRVLRGELKNRSNRSSKPNKRCSTNNGEQRKRVDNAKMRDNVDIASLALHLAQNQLRQGLTEHAEKSIQDAIRAMQDLESTVCGESEPHRREALVREPATTYRIDRKRMASVGFISDRPGFPGEEPKPTGSSYKLVT